MSVLSSLIRSLRILSPEGEIGTGCHWTLEGEESLSLRPAFYILRGEDLPDTAVSRLMAAPSLEIYVAGSRSSASSASFSSASSSSSAESQPSSFSTASGTGADSLLLTAVPEAIRDESAADRRITQVALTAGFSLWSAWVSLSLPSGMTLRDTLQAILRASRIPAMPEVPALSSGSLPRLISFQAPNLTFHRPQSFFGRTADCLSALAAAVDAFLYRTPAGLVLTALSTGSPSLILPESALHAPPIFTGNKTILKTDLLGWPAGCIAQWKWEKQSGRGRILSRTLSADTAEGPWEMQLLLSSWRPSCS